MVFRTMAEVDTFLLAKQREGVCVTLEIVLAPVGAVALLAKDERVMRVMSDRANWNKYHKTCYRMVALDMYTVADFNECGDLADVKVESAKIINEQPI